MIAPSPAPIRVHRFGRTDLQVSAFGLGCARIGGVFKSNASEFVHLLSAALDRGITFFDTADMYSQGESEQLIGRAFRRQRDRVVIASKVGWLLPPQRQLVARIKPIVRPIIKLLGITRSQLPSAVSGAMTQDFSAAYLTSAVEGSLRRLRMDHLDLLQLHSPPAEIVAAGEWLDALESLRRAGKIRYYGISCDTVEAAHAALRYGGVASLQLPINLLATDFVPLLHTAQTRGVGVIARECLANGLLVKELSAGDLGHYCQTAEEAAAKGVQLDALRRIASSHNLSLAQLALKYVTGLPGVSVTLLGVSRLEQLTDLAHRLPPVDDTTPIDFSAYSRGI